MALQIGHEDLCKKEAIGHSSCSELRIATLGL